MKAKTHLSQAKSRGGFTLVEMLVVIGMIAALAGISFPVYRGIQKKVEKQQLEMDMQALETAVDNFETEYNYIPYIGNAYPAADDVWTGAEISSFFTTLVDLPSAANFKQIKFFDVREAKGGAGNYNSGLLISGNSANYYTPWGTQLYVMIVDHNMDGTILHGYGAGDVQSEKKYTYAEQGPDGQWGSNAATDDDFTNYDDVRP